VMPYPANVVGLPLVILLQSRFGMSAATKERNAGAAAPPEDDEGACHTPAYMRPGLKMPAGSREALMPAESPS
jgi:hypothetical protein